MSSYFTKQVCDKIKENNKITNYLKEKSVKIDYKSKKPFIVCPFHDDKNPSCVINEGEVDTFKCFGCGQKGSIIDLYQQMEDKTLAETIKDLSYGLNIDIDIKSVIKDIKKGLLKDQENDIEEEVLSYDLSISKMIFVYLQDIKEKYPKKVFNKEFNFVDEYLEEIDSLIKRKKIGDLKKINDSILDELYEREL